MLRSAGGINQAKMGFIRGARQDPRYAQKQAKELEALSSSSILAQPVDLLKINVGALQGWLCWRIQEVLGGVEDDILAGMIGNVLEVEREKMSRINGPAGSTRSWSPKELQHTLGPFLSEGIARSFMEELWILLLDAESAPDGIPQAWGPADRAKFVGDEVAVESDQVTRKEKVMLGSSAQMRLRSPERVIGRLIEDAKEQSRPRERDRYFDAGSTNDRPAGRGEIRGRHRDDRRDDRCIDRRDDRYDDRRSEIDRYDDYHRRDEGRPSRRGRSRTRSRSRTRAHAKMPSPQRTPSPVHRRQRDFSADTYSSAGSRADVLETRSPGRLDTQPPVRRRSRSPSRQRSSSTSRSPSQSRSRSKRRHRHKKHHKKKHHKKHHPRSHSTSRSRSRSPSKFPSRARSPSRSPSREDREMSHLEKLLRRKALESVQQRSRD